MTEGTNCSWELSWLFQMITMDTKVEREREREGAKNRERANEGILRNKIKIKNLEYC